MLFLKETITFDSKGGSFFTECQVTVQIHFNCFDFGNPLKMGAHSVG